MSFTEKVLTGLEAHKIIGGCHMTSGEKCPYLGDGDCVDKLHGDAIHLIKEQNAEIDRLHIKCNESESENHKLLLRVRQLEQENKQKEYAFRGYEKRLEERTAERDAMRENYERVRRECEKLTSEKIEVARDARIEHETVCEQIKINNKLSEENKKLKQEKEWLKTGVSRYPVLVTGLSKRKYGNCPKCGGSVNDFDNQKACGHCGTLIDWGLEKE